MISQVERGGCATLRHDSANPRFRDLYALGDLEEAQRIGEDTLGRARRVFGDDSHVTVDTANDLAAGLLALGDLEAARQLGEGTVARARRVFGADHPRTLRTAGV